MQISKSSLFHTAWDYFKKQTFSSFSECLKAAWKKLKIKALMKIGFVEITFSTKTKASTTRVATLKAEYLPKSKGTGRKPKSDSLVFFSVTNNALRSFKIQNLISYSPVINEASTGASTFSLTQIKAA